MMIDQPNTTLLLCEVSAGNHDVMEELMRRVYHELRRIAERHLRKERAGHTLNATALVHEAYIKLIDRSQVTWQNRAHFLAIASKAMRRILIQYAESRRAQKRGGGQQMVTLSEEQIPVNIRIEELLVLDELLTQLSQTNERACRIVEAKFFGGLTQEEIAEALNLSTRTVSREWRFARAWLKLQMKQGR